ncbi:MAG: molybdopterin molybdotransferase MoeA [Sphingorhabdus sp.]
MLTVEAAQDRLLGLARPLPSQELSLAKAIGCYLAREIVALRSQPAADLSAMDGYAIRFAELPGPLDLVGESAAGSPYLECTRPGQAVRISTGAHVPEGTDTILVQEEALFKAGKIWLDGSGPGIEGRHIRRAGSDFKEGDKLIPTGALMQAGALAAAAMAGYSTICVGGAPRVKIVGTGNELVPPGTMMRNGQIPSSNNIMLNAMLSQLPCSTTDAGIVGDQLDDIVAIFQDSDAYDIIVTTGGASVGDHDLVQAAMIAMGAEISFWKVAMRPGKPLMAGRIGSTIVVGLPGNPSSAFVTAILFLLPLIRHMAGSSTPLPETVYASSSIELPPTGERCEYLRGFVQRGMISAFGKQDSGLITPLIGANGLLYRAAHAPSLAVGELVPYIAL